LADLRPFRTVGIGAVVAIGTVLIAPLFLDTYSTNILVRALFLATLAMTVDILWGYTGILTFGQSAFFGLGAYTCALVFTHYGFGPGWAIGALIGAVIAGALLGWAVGWLAFYHGASPLYASIITLALTIVAVQLIFAGGRFTGSSSGLSAFPTYYWAIDTWFRIAGCYLVAVAALGWLFVRSDYGRILVAIRENEERCAYLGIPVSRIKTGLMAAAGAVGAVAGFGYAAFTNVVAPELAGFLLGTELLIYTALGGRGTLFGPIFGAIGIDMTASYLSGSLPFMWALLVGVAFVVVIVALPQGLMPPIFNVLRRAVSRWRPGGGAALTVETAAPRTRDADSTPILVAEGLTRSYGSLQVLEGIDLVGRRGEIVGVVGPNGAGKTTLMRCLSDGGERTAGTVTVGSAEIRRTAPDRVAGLGMGRSFQHTNLFDTLTVGECLTLSRYSRDGTAKLTRRSRLELPEPAVGILRATGLLDMLDVETRNLSHGMKRGLELAMVLATEPSVLLLDEPTAGLTKAERRAIGEVLLRLARDFGLCIFLIEHDLDFVREVSSRIVVLHQGRLLMEGSVEEVIDSDLVRSVYSGKPAGEAA
jgi:branched-chain amino acid transport system permease protein